MISKTIRNLIAVIGIVCLCLTTTPALWAHGDCGWQCLTPGVKLTADQEGQVKAIYNRYLESTKSLREQLETAEAAQQNQSGAFNEAAVRSAAEARARSHVELEVALAKARAEAENLLTTDQKTQLAEHRKQMAEQCHQHGGESMH